MDNILAKYSNKWLEIRQTGKNFITEFWSYLYFKIYIICLLLIVVVNWSTAFYIDYQISAGQAALHYNVDFGIDYYGDTRLIYIIPALGLFIILLNITIIFISRRHQDKKFISHILLTSASIANFVLWVALSLLYLVNL